MIGCHLSECNQTSQFISVSRTLQFFLVHMFYKTISLNSFAFNSLRFLFIYDFLCNFWFLFTCSKAYDFSPLSASLKPGVSTTERRTLTPFSSISSCFLSMSTVCSALSVTKNVNNMKEIEVYILSEQALMNQYPLNFQSFPLVCCVDINVPKNRFKAIGIIMIILHRNFSVDSLLD